MPKEVVTAGVLMAVAAAFSNWLVEFPINGWLTYGGLTYPLTFLINELTNRRYGPRAARNVVFIGLTAVPISLWISSARITAAFATAYAWAQLADIAIFSRLRRYGRWWLAPTVASALATASDTLIFFSLAFGGTTDGWLQLAVGDYCSKLVVDIGMLGPYRLWARHSRRF